MKDVNSILHILCWAPFTVNITVKGAFCYDIAMTCDEVDTPTDKK